MKQYLLLAASAFLLQGCQTSKEDIKEQPLKMIEQIDFSHVKINDNFWSPRLSKHVSATLPVCIDQIENQTGRIRNFENAAKGEGEHSGIFFDDSDVYKALEGMAYSLINNPDPELEKKADEWIDKFAAAQQPDGYINTFYTLTGLDKRWTNMDKHEMYCAGHMIEAGVAYYQATGKRKLLDVCIRMTDHMMSQFGPGKRHWVPGHEEIELALCKLYRVTNDPLYLDMAKKFLEIRGVTYRPEGEGVMAATYAQQHAPVSQQTEAVGHAVRAAYLYTAMAQVDALTGLHDYDKALQAIWNNLVTTRMHITGGLGAVEGMEGFGAPYELPNLTAYNETCAAVANVFFNQGLFLGSGDAKFWDIAELSLFNNALAGINLKGDRFFYVNPLEADGERRFNHGNGGRAEWFGCACCPPNISRLILQVPGYMYAYSKDNIYLTLYGGSRTTIPLKGGKVALEQESGYPFDGKVRLVVIPEKKERFSISMRIPTWATKDEFVPGGLYPYEEQRHLPVEVRVNGEKVKYVMKKGFAVIERDWVSGDIVELELPMPVRFVDCIPEVEDNVGKTAVTRGPLVYCAEEIDNGRPVQQLFLGDATEEKAQVTIEETGELKGLDFIKVGGISLVPYYAWCNRGDNRTMLVWLNKEVSTVGLQQGEMKYMDSIGKISASSVASGNAISEQAVCDGKVATSSADFSLERWVSIPAENGKGQQLTFDFKTPYTLNSLSVYWLENPQENILLPVSWKVEYKSKGIWKVLELYVTDSYQLGKDRFNVIHPSSNVEVEAIRLNIDAQQGKSVGISEVRFE